MPWYTKFLPAPRKKSFSLVPSLAGRNYNTASISKSPTLAACLRYIQNGILEAPLVFEAYDKSQEAWTDAPWPAELEWLRADVVAGGIVQQTHASRIQGVAADLAIYGNAVLFILRNEAGQPVGVERLPWAEVSPEISGNTIVSYRYGVMASRSLTATGRPGHRLAPEDVVHIRRGADTREPCLGESLMPALLEPMAADAEAARYMARMLQSPSPGLLLQDPDLDPADAERMAQEIARATTGEKAGSTIVLNSALSMSSLGYSPEDMALRELVDHPQHAICSLLGIPPQALDVSAGRNASTYNNVAEASKKAARSGLAPLWETIEQALTDQLLGEPGFRLSFRTSDVRALQPDEDLKAKRAATLYQSGVIDRAEAMRILDLDPTDADVGWYSSYDRMPAPLSSSEVQQIRDQVGA